jgi:AraC-like DNA-binding protein
LTVYRFLPAPPLSALVEAFCFSEGEASLQTKERRLPDGRVALVMNVGHERLRVSHREQAEQFQSFHGGVLCGAHSQFSVLDTTTLVTTLYVCFKPGGVRPFLSLPASELTNQVVDLSHVFGTAAFDLREQLQAAQTNDERVRILWADLALSCGFFDQAHFIHDFQAFTGLTPSAYLAQRGEQHNHVPLPD